MAGFGTLAQAPGDILQSLDYSRALTQNSFRDFLQYMHSVLLDESELRAEGNRALWDPMTNVKDEQCNRSDRGTERARYASTLELVMENLQSERSRV